VNAAFPGLGTVINVATVVVGALLGMAVGHRLPERTRSLVTDCLGLVTLLIAALSCVSVTDASLREAVGTGVPVLVVLGSLLMGGITGSLLRIEERLEGLAGTIQSWMARRRRFAGGDRAGGDRAGGDRAGGDRAEGDRAEGDPAWGDRAGGDRAEGDRAEGDRAEGDPAWGDRGGGGRAGGDRGWGDRAGGDRAGAATAGNTAGDAAADDSPRARERFIEGWLTASLLFCVGPLTILGSLSDGLGRGIEQLTLKAVLDGFAAMAFASSFGVGVLMSAVSVAVIQGLLTGVGVLLGSVLPDANIAALTATGGLMLVGISLRLLRIRDIPVANMLPALIVAPVLTQVVVALRRA
jgi:uncharacterized membrane protein YqgA involved in biofilm formation